MNDERIPWQADDLESGAVQVSGRPVHASWSMLREHFRRVFLEPHRPAGSDVVGWRWLGASVPRAPEAADLADIRQLLQHALLDITADLERRAEDPATTSPKELLAAIQTIVHDLSEGTDIDLAMHAVETDTGWFIRSWGFSHPAPAKLADPSAAAAETPAEPEDPAEHAAHGAPVAKPPVTKRTLLMRWAAGGVVVIGAAAVLFWFKGHARTSSAAVKPDPPAQANGDTHEAPAAEAAQQGTHLTTHASAAEAPAHGDAVAHGDAATSTTPAESTITETHSHEVAAGSGADAGAAHEAPAHGVAYTPVPSAQIGGMPELPGQTGALGGAHAPVTSNTEALSTHITHGGPETTNGTPAHTADAASTAGADAAKHTGANSAAPINTAHEGGKEGAEPTLGSRTLGLSPEAPPAAAKEAAPGTDAVLIPDIHSQPVPEATHPAPPPPAEAAPATPEGAQPAEAKAAAAAPKSAESPAVEKILEVTKTTPPPAPDQPAPILFQLPPEVLAASHFTAASDANAPSAGANETGSAPSGNVSANTEAGGANTGAPASAPPDHAETSAPADGVAPAKPKKRTESTSITYQIGEVKVRSFRDPVLATTPAERPSNPMLAEARGQAWAGTQASKPESFRKPVVNGGWNFRPAKGATWTKHPVWLDTTTGKPVDGLRVSTNGLHLNWTGLVPAEGFTAHVVDEDGIEQARMTFSPAERRIEVTTIAVFSESSPSFTVDLTSREAVAGALVWRSRTPTWSDRRWETQLTARQISVNCLPTPALIKEPTFGVVALSHPASGWALTWEVTTHPTAKTVEVP